MKEDFIHWILSKGVFKTGENFACKSGMLFDFETDLREAYCDMKSALITTKYIFDLIIADTNDFDYFIGVPESGTLIALYLNIEKYNRDNRNFKFNLLRSVPKNYQGSTNSVHTVLKHTRGDKIVLIEDDVVTGNTLINTLESILNLGFEVIKIISVIDRLEKENKIHSYNIPYTPLITIKEIIKAAKN